MGVTDEILTYLETGRIAEDEGVAAISLHARTAEQLYSGSARWDAIAALKAHVTSIPVLGNGDIWEASDALAMIEQRSEEHTSELQSLMRISYAVFCLKKQT